jgi:CheY-like chemotaxis protein
MAHLLPYPKPPEPPLPPPTKSIKASPRSALLVENDESLLNFLRRSLTDEGYEVHPASNSEEGLRLYRDCGPFNVVLIDHCVPQSKGPKIDYWAPQTNGIELARTIHEINPLQGIIIATFDYRNAKEVPRPRELMHIPLLLDASNFQLRRLLEKIEVDRAMEALTRSELLRLQRFADYRVQGLGRAACGRTGEDLLSEAQLRTLIGAGATREGRHWNKHVDFVWHLTGAMRSIASCWKRQFKEEYLMSETLIHDAEGQEHSPLDNAASGHAAADQLLIEKNEEDRVLTIFKDDPEATQVLQGLLDGLKKNEIMLTYGLDEKKYAAAVKRILKLLGRRNGGSKG